MTKEYNRKYYAAHRGKATAARVAARKRRKARAAKLAAELKLSKEERGALITDIKARHLGAADKVFVKELAKSGNKTKAMRKARPELRQPGMAAAIALKRPAVQKALSALLQAQKKLGINETYLSKKLKEGLNANEVKFFAHEGEVVSERVTVDHSARRGYLELAHKLRRDLEPEKGGDGQSVIINITEISGDASGPDTARVVAEAKP